MHDRIEDMEKERMKLTKDMFEAGDIYRKLKHKQRMKNKRKSLSKPDKQYNIFQNNDEPMTKPQNTPSIEKQKNSVIVWSISDNICPKVFNLIMVYVCNVLYIICCTL